MQVNQTYDFGIVVPVGPGQRKWLLQTLRSLDIQTVNVSVAVCAVEDSEELKQTLESFSHLISYARCGPDTGQSAAINEGWAALNAQYYGWLNDDDMLHPDGLSIVLETFRTSNADVVFGRTDILEDDVLRVGYGHEPLGDSLRRENRIAQPSTFVKHSALEKQTKDPSSSPLNPDKHYAMDWDLWQRLYLTGASFHGVSEPLSITRWYAGTKTANLNWSKFKEYHQLLKSGKAGPKGIWALFNIVIHHFATYSRISAPFRFLHRILSMNSSSRSSVDIGSVSLDVFHYQTQALRVISSRTSDTLEQSLKPGEVLKTSETRVSLQKMR